MLFYFVQIHCSRSPRARVFPPVWRQRLRCVELFDCLRGTRSLVEFIYSNREHVSSRELFFSLILDLVFLFLCSWNSVPANSIIVPPIWMIRQWKGSDFLSKEKFFCPSRSCFECFFPEFERKKANELALVFVSSLFGDRNLVEWVTFSGLNALALSSDRDGDFWLANLSQCVK